MLWLCYRVLASRTTLAVFGAVASAFVILVVFAVSFAAAPFARAAANPYCGPNGVWIQVLGSGGSDLAQGRAGASYLIWENGRARVLVDVGAGSAVNFAKSGAHFSDLEAVLLTNLHPDSWVDLPVLLRRSYYGRRKTELPVLAPEGNDQMDSLKQALAPWYQLNARHIYPAELLASLPIPPSPHADFRLRLQSVSSIAKGVSPDFFNQTLSIHSAAVDFGIIPAASWRVSIGGLRIAIIGNVAGPISQIEAIAENVDILVMHLNIEEGRRGALKRVMLTPSRIGKLAGSTEARLLLLGHRMGRTVGLETVNRPTIEQHFKRSLKFADDNDCFSLKPRTASP